MNLETKLTRERQHTFTNVDDIIIPEIMFKPIRFAEALPNIVFSELGGIIPSQVIFMTGEPGSGKSTLCSKLGAILKSEKSPVFLSLEMSDFQLKLQARKINGFNKYFIVNNVESLDGILLDLIDFDPSVVILDSVQELAYKILSGRDKDQIEIVDRFKQFAKDSYIPVILIGHCNKDGTYKGPSAVLHNVDTHVHVYVEKESGERLFRVNKNRMGGDCTPIPFKITSTNVMIGNFMYDPYDEDKSPKTNEDKLAILKPKLEEALKNMANKNKPLEKTNFLLCKPVLEIGIEYLSTKYADYMKTDTLTETNEIKLTWQPTSTSWCKAGSSHINFSPKVYNRFKNIVNYGYRKEHPFTAKYCKGKKEALALWIMFHEFTHLFKNMQNHKQRFFEKIEEFVKNEIWMFNILENELSEKPQILVEIEKELLMEPQTLELIEN